jgi:uncharacterized membrane protein YgcG
LRVKTPDGSNDLLLRRPREAVAISANKPAKARTGARSRRGDAAAKGNVHGGDLDTVIPVHRQLGRANLLVHVRRRIDKRRGAVRARSDDAEGAESHTARHSDTARMSGALSGGGSRGGGGSGGGGRRAGATASL